MPDSEAKRKCIKENSIVFSVKFMQKGDKDIIDFLNENLTKGVKKNTLIKLALREYMENHKEDNK